jgi:thiol:disulfide interchange protein DsbD
MAGLAAVAAIGQAAGPKLLPADEAFRLSARALDAATLEVRFDVADGYYLYRDKLRFEVEPASSAPGTPVLPPGKIHDDEFFGKSTIYRGPTVIRLPLKGGKAGDKLKLTADSQGCADAGVCYPPQRRTLAIALPTAGAAPGPLIEATPRKPGYFN